MESLRKRGRPAFLLAGAGAVALVGIDKGDAPWWIYLVSALLMVGIFWACDWLTENRARFTGLCLCTAAYMCAVFWISRPGDPALVRFLFAGPAERATATPSERVYIQASPDDLVALVKNLTSVQGDAVAAGYVGKWMRVSSNVENVSGIPTPPDGHPRPLVLLQESPGKAMTGARFDPEWQARTDALVPRQRVVVVGRIRGFTWNSVSLEECELVSDASPQPSAPGPHEASPSVLPRN